MRLRFRRAATAAAAALWWAATPVLASESLEELGANGRAEGFNLLVITLDTVRADHLGCYGYPGAATPVLDALAARGVRFVTAMAPAPITLPSHASLFTGLEIPDHGVRNNGTFRLDASYTTMAECLQRAGYRTGAFVAAYVLDKRFGLAQGFDVYDDRISSGGDFARAGQVSRRGGSEVTRAALEWLERTLPAEGEEGPAAEPFFAWVHYFDAHAPYQNDGAQSARFAERPYDGAIAFMDEEVARILVFLDERGVRDRTLVVLTADHGEGLGEHGESTHSRFIYDATMRVPLILSCPGLFTREVVVEDRVVSLLDVFPTVLDLLSVEHGAASSSARNLFTAPRDRERAIYLETLVPYLNNGWASLHGLRRLEDKYILAPRPEYYDVAGDPRESRNLLAGAAADPAAAPDEARALAADLDSRLASWPPVEGAARAAAAMSAEERQRLVSLGYIDYAGEAGSEERPDPKDMIEGWERSSVALEMSALGRHAEAAAEIDRALQANPRDAQAWQNAALIYQRMGQMERAFGAISNSVRLYPTAERYVKLAQYLLGGRKVAEAREALLRAERLDPTEGGIYIVRGQILCAEGKLAEAIPQFERALEVDPVMSGTMAREMIRRVKEQVGG